MKAAISIMLFERFLNSLFSDWLKKVPARILWALPSHFLMLQRRFNSWRKKRLPILYITAVSWNMYVHMLVGINCLELISSSWRISPTALNSLQIFRTCRFGKLGNGGCGIKSRKMFRVSFLYILLRLDSSLFYWISRLCNSCVICDSGGS